MMFQVPGHYPGGEAFGSTCSSGTPEGTGTINWSSPEQEVSIAVVPASGGGLIQTYLYGEDAEKISTLNPTSVMIQSDSGVGCVAPGTQAQLMLNVPDYLLLGADEVYLTGYYTYSYTQPLPPYATYTVAAEFELALVYVPNTNGGPGQNPCTGSAPALV